VKAQPSLMESASSLMDARELVASEIKVLQAQDPHTNLLSESWRYRYLKRSIDFVGSSALLIVCAVPGLAIAAAIRLTSRGPVFYREERIGHKGRPFRIWKFRSMHHRVHSHVPSSIIDISSPVSGVVESNVEWRMRKGDKNFLDPRITFVGGFLRKWSLDELPQLINVLRGDMSLIGPRPIVRDETSLYGDRFSYYLAAKPGLSGLSQVSGRSNLGYDKRVELDAMYVRNWSLTADIAILARTIPTVLSRTGAR
jgi:exopolysaccharide production protein ExoY